MSDRAGARPAKIELLKEIPPLMPLFLRRRRAGLPVVRGLVEELGIDRELFFMLVQIYLVQGSYNRASVSPGQLWAYDPYNAIDHYTEPLVKLKAQGLLLENSEGHVSLAPRAVEAVERLHDAGRAHVAALRPLPRAALDELAAQLEIAVRALLEDPLLAPRPGSHLAGSRSHAPADNPPSMVRIEQAVLDLWSARDDAHIRAWRDAGLEGPPMAVLTALWSGRAHDLGELYNLLKSDQTAGNIDNSLSFLAARDYVTRDGDDILLMPGGVLVREDVERETNRIYFESWPHTEAQVEWMRDNLLEVVGRLPAAPR